MEEKREKKTRKRGHGEGSIYQRKDGRWTAQITTGYDPKTGKQIRRTVYGRTRQEVNEKMTEILRSIQLGTYVAPNKLTFGEWLDIWLEEYVKPHVRPSTYDNYGRWIRNHVKKDLGNIELIKLQTNQIQRFYNQKLKEKKLNGREGTLSTRSVRYMHTLIHDCLEQAVKEGKIYRNPAKATKPPKVEKREVSYLSTDQINNFLKQIADDPWYIAFLVALGTGLRVGELAALRWENVDLEKGIIKVKEAVYRVKNDDKRAAEKKTKLIFQPPKTEKGRRVVPLPENIRIELKRHRKAQAQTKLLLGAMYKDEGFVFAWEDGRMVTPDYLSKRFLKLIRDAGYEGIHFHSLRHSYASALLKAGEHPKVVQELLGHSTITVTLDTYSHVEPELKKRAAEKINDFLERKNLSLEGKG